MSTLASVTALASVGTVASGGGMQSAVFTAVVQRPEAQRTAEQFEVQALQKVFGQ